MCLALLQNFNLHNVEVFPSSELRSQLLEYLIIWNLQHTYIIIIS